MIVADWSIQKPKKLRSSEWGGIPENRILSKNIKKIK